MNEGKCLKTLSNSLYAVISQKGWSVSTAADFCGIHRNELSAILNCKKDVRLSTLIRISEGIGKSLVFLICPEEVGKGGAA